MKLIHDRLNYCVTWSRPNFYLFTGNPAVRADGALVMGRGAAREVRDFYPGIDQVFGQMVINTPGAHLLWAKIQDEQYIGWFKVKSHWSNPAQLELIQESTRQLNVLARANKKLTFLMNFPGIGNGSLRYEDVLPILSELPNNVHIYKIAEQLEEDEIPW